MPIQNKIKTYTEKHTVLLFYLINFICSWAIGKIGCGGWCFNSWYTHEQHNSKCRPENMKNKSTVVKHFFCSVLPVRLAVMIFKTLHVKYASCILNKQTNCKYLIRESNLVLTIRLQLQRYVAPRTLRTLPSWPTVPWRCPSLWSLPSSRLRSRPLAARTSLRVSPGHESS